MRKQEKKKWDNMKDLLKKGLYLLFLLLIISLFLVLLFLLPDIIMYFRSLLYGKLGSIINLTYISSSVYTQMMINIISCCITAVLSYFTYRLTKILRMMEAEQYGAKLVTAAFRLKKNIEINCWIIFESRNNESTLDELQYNSDLDEIWFVLREADEINKEDTDFLEKYNDKIKEMIDFCGTSDQTKELEIDFCNTFLAKNKQFSYNDQTKKLLLKLENIIERSTYDE